ncbi:MAG: His/Gly/Thr/Pro-type tRNA ligase C-terminal domain-containing protein [Candidatus ainarchaeum sp.]|nr:His/Gly/Thr/Pro-type tRNA ligase C-terminal domain-containing protein [Candidatus ainarchaeum sp.]
MFINKNELEFSEWWNKIIFEGGLADNRYKIKGLFVWMPYGFSLMKMVKKNWDNLFEQNNISELYFPLFVPQEYAKQNESWWNSFKEQAFYVLGYFDNEKKVFLRPTGEPAMYPMFSLWIRSHRDLPLRVYETVSSFRNETKSTKTFVRDVEIGPWYEIHTVHSTREEAEAEIELGIKMNDIIFDNLAVSRLKVRKPIQDCFPGSVGAIEFYTLLNDKLVENASCNNLGQAYAKAFNIKFFDENEKEQFAWQTCTGNGERFLSAIIGNHSDDKGLVLPPVVAPIQVAIIPIKISVDEINKLNLDFSNLRVKEFPVGKSIGDVRYKTEKMGIPLRIEIGPNEISEKKAVLIWRNGKKESCLFSDLNKVVVTGLDNFQKDLRLASENEMIKRIKICDNKIDAKKADIAIIGWCGSAECSDWLQTDLEKELIGMTLEKKKVKCLHCEKDGEATYFSKSY